MDRRGILWTVAGVVFLVLVVFLMLQFRQETDPSRELAFKASRVDIVGRMELSPTNPPYGVRVPGDAATLNGDLLALARRSGARLAALVADGRGLSGRTVFETRNGGLAVRLVVARSGHKS